MPIEPLPAEVIAAIHSGNTVTAIKLLRETSGLGLKEAKGAVEAYQRGELATHMSGNPTTKHSAGELPAEVLGALLERRKIEAIKLLRDRTGMGLKEAKEAIETYQQMHPTQSNTYPSGEVSRTSDRLWLIVLVLAVTVIAYYFLRHSA